MDSAHIVQLPAFVGVDRKIMNWFIFYERKIIIGGSFSWSRAFSTCFLKFGFAYILIKQSRVLFLIFFQSTLCMRMVDNIIIIIIVLLFVEH